MDMDKFQYSHCLFRPFNIMSTFFISFYCFFDTKITPDRPNFYSESHFLIHFLCKHVKIWFFAVLEQNNNGAQKRSADTEPDTPTKKPKIWSIADTLSSPDKPKSSQPPQPPPTQSQQQPTASQAIPVSQPVKPVLPPSVSVNMGPGGHPNGPLAGAYPPLFNPWTLGNLGFPTPPRPQVMFHPTTGHPFTFFPNQFGGGAGPVGHMPPPEMLLRGPIPPHIAAMMQQQMMANVMNGNLAGKLLLIFFLHKIFYSPINLFSHAVYQCFMRVLWSLLDKFLSFEMSFYSLFVWQVAIYSIYALFYFALWYLSLIDDIWLIRKRMTSPFLLLVETKPGWRFADVSHRI